MVSIQASQQTSGLDIRHLRVAVVDVVVMVEWEGTLSEHWAKRQQATRRHGLVVGRYWAAGIHRRLHNSLIQLRTTA